MNKEIEALLFVRGKDGLSTKQFAQATKMSTPDARKVLNSFAKKWNNEEHGISVVNFDDNFKFITNKEQKDIISEVITIDKKQRLSSAAIETVGIIAYKQPITKSQINEIRGVASEAVVNTLLQKNLIKEAGYLDTPGNPALFKISNAFYDYFNIQSLKELPKLSEFEEENTEDFELFSSQRDDS